jgi:hypothetical protein
MHKTKAARYVPPGWFCRAVAWAISHHGSGCLCTGR